MTDLAAIFDHRLDFDAGGDFEALVGQVPARWAVYLLTDAGDRPIQLLCVKNLRYSIKRRLGGAETASPSRRVDYRQVVGRIHWRRVESAFEADWRYLEAARVIFPETYRGMVGFGPAWFVHVEAEATFPRLVKTIDLSERPGVLIGPVPDKHAAQRLAELVEDAFDLCRYHHILTQAPHGKACAYKGMGKCPAPCDGTISMEQYRRSVAEGAEAMVEPAAAMARLGERMNEAARAKRFEEAGRLKSAMDQLGRLGRGAFRHARRLEDFRYVAAGAGPRRGTAKLMLITPQGIEEIAGLIGVPGAEEDWAGLFAEQGAGAKGIDADLVAVAAQHLLAKKPSGAMVRVGDRVALARAIRVVFKQPEAAEASESEGLVKELGDV